VKSELKIAVQKKGRLKEESIRLIRDCGIRFSVFNGQLKATADNYPLQLLFLRASDIPNYVAGGVADLGIVGYNLVAEYDSPVRILKDLGFSRCRLSIAVERNARYRGVGDLEGLSIATSHPRLLSRYLRENKVKARIHRIAGSVEVAPAMGVADAVCDLVTTGSTLLSNGLKEVASIASSTATLIGDPHLSQDQKSLVDGLLLRINAVIRAREYKYILLNAPRRSLDAICRLLPGMKSPTVSSLKDRGWVSVQSVVRETQFWEMVEKLHDLGARGILVVGVEKMVF